MTIKAAVRRSPAGGFTHLVQMRHHQMLIDEPQDSGGCDRGPSPLEMLAASLAACTAITVEMYAQRKGWDVGAVDVRVEFDPPRHDEPTRFTLMMRLPSDLREEQVARLQAIAARCPVHRTLAGQVSFRESVQLVARQTLER